MAGIVTHLAIATTILELLPRGKIADEGLFYAGSMAPDAAHAKANYSRADKKRTHFRDGISDRDFAEPANLALFHARLSDFIRENGVNAEKLDLYRGYAAHVLTDEAFMLTVRREFVEKMASLGIAQADRAFFENIIGGIDSVDVRLAGEFRKMDGVRSILENLDPYGIEGYLSENECEVSKNWVLDRYFRAARPAAPSNHISYERMLRFIGDVSVDVIEKLSNGKTYPALF